MGMLDGKTGFIFGVANDRSLAWHIAERLHEQGASLLTLTYLAQSTGCAEELGWRLGFGQIPPRPLTGAVGMTDKPATSIMHP